MALPTVLQNLTLPVIASPMFIASGPKLVSAQERALAREKWLYEGLLDQLQPFVPALTELAQAMASLDVLCALTERSLTLNWCAPEFTKEPCIEIRQGRHPVVEARLAQMSGTSFIANDTVLGEIAFTCQGKRVALEEAPALGFSEAMRDLDLVITAGAADSDEHSAEVQQARVALVSALLPSLGLKNVSVEGHHAIIQGKRASYRLHLGTAVIHVIPAGYLCIVPAGKASPKSVALPFVDDDQRTSEVLSKLLLLSADDKIKDPSILAQIEGRQAEAQA
eukprot:gene41100-50864_t